MGPPGSLRMGGGTNHPDVDVLETTDMNTCTDPGEKKGGIMSGMHPGFCGLTVGRGASLQKLSQEEDGK